MIQVKVYTVKGGRLVAKSPKVPTFKEAYAFLTPFYPEYYIEIHGKKG